MNSQWFVASQAVKNQSGDTRKNGSLRTQHCDTEQTPPAHTVDDALEINVALEMPHEVKELQYTAVASNIVGLAFQSTVGHLALTSELWN